MNSDMFMLQAPEANWIKKTRITCRKWGKKQNRNWDWIIQCWIIIYVVVVVVVVVCFCLIRENGKSGGCWGGFPFPDRSAIFRQFSHQFLSIFFSIPFVFIGGWIDRRFPPVNRDSNPRNAIRNRNSRRWMDVCGRNPDSAVPLQQPIERWGRAGWIDPVCWWFKSKFKP